LLISSDKVSVLVPTASIAIFISPRIVLRDLSVSSIAVLRAVSVTPSLSLIIFPVSAVLVLMAVLAALRASLVKSTLLPTVSVEVFISPVAVLISFVVYSRAPKGISNFSKV